MNFTISIQESENGWLAGQCEQLPEAISQGKDIDELMENIYSAITEALEFRQEQFISDHKNDNYIRKTLYLPSEKKRISKAPQRKRVYA